MLIHRRDHDAGVDREIIIGDDLIEMVEAVAEGNRRHPEPIIVDWRNQAWLGRGFPTQEAVYAACGEAWDEGIEIVEKMLGRLDQVELPRPTSRRRRRRWSDDDGDEVDYDRLRSGRQFWRKTHRTNVSGPQIVTLISDMRAPCFRSAEEVLWRGAASVVLTKLLEEAGYRVELWAAQAERQAYHDDGDMLFAVRVKRSGDPLDLGACIASVSSWFYRLIGFWAANMALDRVPDAVRGLRLRQGVGDAARRRHVRRRDRAARRGAADRPEGLDRTGSSRMDRGNREQSRPHGQEVSTQ